MISRSLLNLILLLMVAVLSTVLLLDEGTIREEVPTVAALEPGTIDTIRIQGRGELVFNRTPRGWRVAGPDRLPARPERVRALLGLPDTPSRDRLNAEGADLAALGLHPPRLTLQLGEARFAFGDTDPIAGLRYVLHHDRIHLIEDHLYPQMRQGLAFFLAPVLVPEGFGLERVVLPGQVLSRDGATERLDRWQEARALQVLSFRGTADGYRVVLEGRAGELHYTLIPLESGLSLARPELGIQYLLDSENAAGLGLQAPADE